SPERKQEFRNPSNIPIKRVYTPRDVAYQDESRDAGLPGEYPYLRGVYPTLYRGRLWTMRMFSGFGTPEDTNKRLHYLLEHGETGWSTAPRRCRSGTTSASAAITFAKPDLAQSRN